MKVFALIALAFISADLSKAAVSIGMTSLTDKDERASSPVQDCIKLPEDVPVVERAWAAAHPGQRDITSRAVPAKTCMKVKVIYNKNFHDYSLNTLKKNPHAQILEIIAENRKAYNFPGLETSMNFQWEIIYDPSPAATWKAEPTGSDLQGAQLQSHVKHDLNVHHYLFLTGPQSGDSVRGIAYLSTPCLRDAANQKYKVSICEWTFSLKWTGYVFAHEMGHALGKGHDFLSNGGVRKDSNNNDCTNTGGVMDYYGSNAFPTKWSTCSKEDFKKFYDSNIATYNSFCLAKTCADSIPTTATPPKTTKGTAKPTTKGTTKPTTKAACVDTGEWCYWMARRNRCNRGWLRWYAENHCKKTCGLCTTDDPSCKDLYPDYCSSVRRPWRKCRRRRWFRRECCATCQNYIG